MNVYIKQTPKLGEGNVVNLLTHPDSFQKMKDPSIPRVGSNYAKDLDFTEDDVVIFKETNEKGLLTGDRLFGYVSGIEESSTNWLVVEK